jgi:hypothetical protein
MSHTKEDDFARLRRVGAEAINSDSSVVVSKVVQEQAFTALDVVEDLREGLIALPDIANNLTFSRLFMHLEASLNRYDASVKQDRINLAALTEAKAADQDLQKVGATYGMTMNQVVGYMDMCEQVNEGMSGTGIVAVPFWFYAQYTKLQELNKALIEETNSLMATLSKVQQGGVEGLGLELPTRRNIITGSTTPYIAGETGPRFGDEHLDHDNVYIPPEYGKKR